MEMLITDRPLTLTLAAPVPRAFTSGWGVLPGFGDCAHRFTREAPRPCSIDGVPQFITPVVTACGHGRFEFGHTVLRGMGDAPRCKRCEQSKGAA